MVMLLQEADPWNLVNTVAPILVAFICLVCKHAMARKLPNYNWDVLMKSIVGNAIAFSFFARGLDERTDPYRSFHGCWHISLGFVSYINFDIVKRESQKVE
jgi:predicted membrane channel-forming protein YqfA (hemolysin III family)